MRGQDRFYIVMMRPGGRVRRTRVSMGCLVIAVLFAVVFTAASIWVFNRYYDEARENRELRVELEQLARLVHKSKPSGEEQTDYENLAATLERAESEEEPEDLIEDTDVPVVDSTPNPDVPEAEPPTETGVETAPGPDEVVLEVQDPMVEISDLTMTPNPQAKTLGAIFKVQKIKQDQATLSGYIVMVLKNENVDPVVTVVHPAGVELDRGAPKNIQSGDAFAIRSFKEFHLTVKNPDAATFNHAVIYAFREDGRLVGKLDTALGQ